MRIDGPSPTSLSLYNTASTHMLASFEFDFEHELLMRRRGRYKCRRPSVTSTLCLFLLDRKNIDSSGVLTHMRMNKFTSSNKIVIFASLIGHLGEKDISYKEDI